MSPSRNPMILIVDDDSETRAAIRLRLKDDNYSVTEASDCEQAKSILEKEPVDGLLLDTRLASGDSIEFVRWVRRHGQYQNIPVILLAPPAEPDENILAAYEAGANDFFCTSQSSKIFLARVKSLLSIRNLEDMLRVRNRDLENTLEELKRINSAKDEFIANLTHEIQTPVAIIRENLHILLDESAGPLRAEQKNFLDSAVRNIDRVNAIMEDLFAISKVDSGNFVLFQGTLHPEKFIHDVTASFELVCGEKKVTLVSDADADIEAISADENRLFQVFSVFLSNAIRHSPAGSQVKLKAENEGWSVLFTIHDEGPGIEEERLKMLFDTFERASGTKIRETYRKTGLSLIVAKKIIEAHRGTLKIESRKGEGTTVFVRIPKEHREELIFYETFSKNINEAVTGNWKFCIIDLVLETWSLWFQKYPPAVLSEFLLTVTRVVQFHATRPHDKIFHFQEGRLAVILPRTDLAGAQAVAEKIRQDLAKIFSGGPDASPPFVLRLSEYPDPEIFWGKDWSLVSVLLGVCSKETEKLWTKVLEDKKVDLHRTGDLSEALEMIKVNRYNFIILEDIVLGERSREFFLFLSEHIRPVPFCIILATSPQTVPSDIGYPADLCRIIRAPFLANDIETLLWNVRSGLKEKRG